MKKGGSLVKGGGGKEELEIMLEDEGSIVVSDRERKKWAECRQQKKPKKGRWGFLDEGGATNT